MRIQGYKQLSVCIHKEDELLELYKRLGYELYREQDKTYTYVLKI